MIHLARKKKEFSLAFVFWLWQRCSCAFVHAHLYISACTHAQNVAERFLFVVGATYIYGGSNNKRGSAPKTNKSLSQVRSNLTGSPVASGCQLGASELFLQCFSLIEKRQAKEICPSFRTASPKPSDWEFEYVGLNASIRQSYLWCRLILIKLNFYFTLTWLQIFDESDAKN